MTEAKPKYFRCDTTIFVKIESLQEFGVLGVSSYIGRKIARLVHETNLQHRKLPSGKMVLESGEITTAIKDKRPRGRFKE